MAIKTPSLPPPIPSAVVPPPPAARPPIAFRSYRGSTSGSRRTVFVGDATPGTFTFTGEFYRPSALRAFRIGQSLLSLTMLGCLFVAMVVGLGADEGESAPIVPVLLVLAFGSMIGLIVWRSVLQHSVESATLLVHAADIRRVRATVNYTWISWWLLIGPFALIPMFAGRRLVRMELPVDVDGRADMLPLALMEERRGDAEGLATRLRMGGAR